ncbi:adp-ribosylation factor-like protein 6 [Stylonychia lemnae]|uniref:Adp-ribosylation factor-like protein 6 n=1 Tax=Stylonychia lemnae TaxID=5949 RepID=A0A078B124_STYLE|nr:adp-ribosylation factor-like protein 6 [Stylonychia lemnae]|eukprot:CDW87057.1 adp-ribosylation factor-like protein 6 [Stylonychia lemnae]
MINTKTKYSQLLMIGLDYSGKTTLIKRFKTIPENSAEFFHTTPYINIEKITLPFSSKACVVYDLSGQGRYRENWSFFYPDVDGIFFVVDSADRDRLSIVQEVLMHIAKHPSLNQREIPFIILANKQDQPDSVDELMLRKILQVDTLKTMNSMRYFVKNVIGITGQGISECFQMFEGRT